MLREYASILDGKSKTIKLTKKQAKHAAAFGINTKGNYAIVDNTPGMRVVKDKRDPFGYRLKFPDGTRAISFSGSKGSTFDTYFSRLTKQFEGKRGRIEFKIAGHQSKLTFHNIREAINYLESYKSVKRAIKGKYERDVIKQITFYTTRRR